MALEYPGEWKFEGVGFGVPPEGVRDFIKLMLDVAGDSKDALEDFKSAFGRTDSSSDFGFAVTDLRTAVNSRASNAAVFVESLWSGIESAAASGLKVPSAKVINTILGKHAIPLKLDPPRLILEDGDAVLVEGTANSSDSDHASPLFVLGERIGSGGYGVVYRATRTTAVGEFEYALKVLDPSPFVADYGKAIRRFQREVKAMQSLQHRAIVPYYEAGLTNDNQPYIVMPYINGVDLRTAASATDAGGVLSMFLEITAALEYAHGQNVLHRDLKPSNVIVRVSDQQPIILDFGSAYLLDYIDSHSLTSQVVGTIGYIPSEVLNNPKERSPSQDVYACGVMLYECLAGRMPDLADYEPLEGIEPAYRPLDPVIRMATARPAKRIRSAAELHTQLSRIRDSLEE